MRSRADPVSSHRVTEQIVNTAWMTPTGQSTFALVSPAKTVAPFDAPFLEAVRTKTLPAVTVASRPFPDTSVSVVPSNAAAEYAPYAGYVASNASRSALNMKQSERASLPAAELVPAGHEVQDPAPVLVLVLNVPASHAVHASSTEPQLCPAGQELRICQNRQD